MIEVKNLVFNYPGNKHKVFDGLNLTLKENRIYGLLGKNGMGKSTLLYLIAGLLRPKKGNVCVDGIEAKERRPEMLREIYVVPEEYNLPNLTLKQYVKVHQDFYPRFSEEILMNCLRDFEMQPDVNFKHLSMGQKKKIYMSFAVASCCQLLLMDEPTNGLDIPSKALFRKVIAGNLPSDSSLIISTHQVHDVEQLLDHVFILNNSEMIVDRRDCQTVRIYLPQRQRDGRRRALRRAIAAGQCCNCMQKGRQPRNHNQLGTVLQCSNLR